MRKFSFILLAAILAASCSQERGTEGKGYLRVRLTPDVSVTPVVKAQAGEPDPAFSLEITSLSSGESTVVEDYRSLEAQPLELKAGRYKVHAFSGPGEAAVWNAPRYEGDAEALVKPEQENVAQVSASLAVSMVTVSFDERTPDFFSQYSVTVANENGDALEFSNLSETLGHTAYFRAKSLSWSLKMVNTAGSTYQLGPIEIADVKPKQHYNLKFTIQEDQISSGGAAVTVKVDDSMQEKEYVLNLFFSDDPLPSIEGDGFSIAAEVSVPKRSASSLGVNFKAPQGIKNLTISHSDAALLSAGLPQFTDLVDAAPGSIAALKEAGVAVSAVPYGTQAVSADFSALLNKLDLGTYSIALGVVDTRNHYSEETLTVQVTSPVDAEAVSATPWAGFAILKGRWYPDTRPAGMTFQYRKASDSQWSDFSGDLSYNDADATFSGELYGLDASTAYVFRAVSDKDKETREIAFTTASAGTIPNLSFDDWYQSGNAWYPGANASSRIWDTANGGTASFGCVPTTPESSDVVAGKAARLESTTVTVVVITKFAAGNIYVGDFVKVSGVGAELDWGYPYTSRPVALHGFYKYMPKVIDNAESPYTSKKGEMDSCSIKMYLVDWSAKFRINTSSKVFLQDDDPSIIAMCDFTTNVTSSDYVEFTLPLQYRDNRTPAYVVIVGAASRLGDYFTGGKGSTLLLDEFSLVWDAGELSESDRSLVGYRNL